MEFRPLETKSIEEKSDMDIEGLRVETSGKGEGSQLEDLMPLPARTAAEEGIASHLIEASGCQLLWPGTHRKAFER